jgi:hypothetical protein
MANLKAPEVKSPEIKSNKQNLYLKSKLKKIMSSTEANNRKLISAKKAPKYCFMENRMNMHPLKR